MNSIDLIRPQLDKIQRMALPIGAIGLVLTVIGFFLRPGDSFSRFI